MRISDWSSDVCSSDLQREIVLVRIGDEIERGEVAVLEIHLVNVVAPGVVDDTAHPGPDRGHRAHAAGLEAGIERRARDSHVAGRFATRAHGLSFAMDRGVATYEIGNTHVGPLL